LVGSSIPLILASFGGPNLGYGVPMRCSYYPQSLVLICRANREIGSWIWGSWPTGCCSSLLALLMLLLDLQQRQKACWYTIRSQIDPQVHGYRCSFHSGVFHGTNFHTEREVLWTWTNLSWGYGDKG
jgi:hypothetical protein